MQKRKTKVPVPRRAKHRGKNTGGQGEGTGSDVRGLEEVAEKAKPEVKSQPIDWSSPSVVPGEAYSRWYREQQKSANGDPFKALFVDSRLVDPKAYD